MLHHTNQHNHSTRRLFTKKRKPQKHGKETHSSLLPNKINTIHTMNWHTHLIISTVRIHISPPPTHPPKDDLLQVTWIEEITNLQAKNHN